MKIMLTEQFQPHLDMDRKGRRTIKVCFLQSVADAIFIKLNRRGEKKVLKCCISVSHQSEGHSHDTRGHQTSLSPHGEEHDKGIQAASV